MIRARYVVPLAVVAVVLVPRVRHFFFGQVLRPSDFEQEQEYHRAKDDEPSDSPQ